VPELHTAHPPNSKTQTTATTARAATTVANTDWQLASRALVGAALTEPSVLGLVLTMD